MDVIRPAAEQQIVRSTVSLNDELPCGGIRVRHDPTAVVEIAVMIFARTTRRLNHAVQ